MGKGGKGKVDEITRQRLVDPGHRAGGQGGGFDPAGRLHLDQGIDHTGREADQAAPALLILKRCDKPLIGQSGDYRMQRLLCLHPDLPKHQPKPLERHGGAAQRAPKGM